VCVCVCVCVQQSCSFLGNMYIALTLVILMDPRMTAVVATYQCSVPVVMW
jgi:hypothetical protein